MTEEIELMPEDFEEEINFELDGEAFNSKELHCSNCNEKMEKVSLDVDIPDTSLSIHLDAFHCNKCGKEYLSGEQADKLDRALILTKAITRKGVVYERASNFDGSNIFVRFPAQMIKGRDIKAEIIPISPMEYLVHFKKKSALTNT